MRELSAVVQAEAASNESEYRLLQDMNQAVQQKYAGLTSQVQQLQPQMQVCLYATVQGGLHICTALLEPAHSCCHDL